MIGDCPHNFPSVVSGQNAPLLLIGAGMSYGHVPMPKTLAAELMKYFSATPHVAPSKYATCEDPKAPSECLYCLSENFLAMPSPSPEHQRYSLAEHIGLFSEDMWIGNIELPFNRNLGRHRAVARLAADARLHCVVSLNWDALLERAFEAIGITPTQKLLDQPGSKTSYSVIVSDTEEFALNTKQFAIYKPHGCVEKLRSNRNNLPLPLPILKVTHSDLNTLDNNAGEASAENPNPDVTHKIYTAWKKRPFIACGWSGSERYLQTISKTVKDKGPSTTQDRLSVISIDWSPSHQIIADSCSTDKDGSLFSVTTPQDTDELFLWAYARFAIQQLANRAPAGVKLAIQKIAVDLEQFTHYRHPTIRFCDDFLPSWTRLCCRLGLVDFYEDGKKLDPGRIPLTPRDWHVPFITHIDSPPECRPDLQSATRLLEKIVDSNEEWDLAAFPGSLWNTEHATLLIPVPHFGKTNSFDLSGMKPLIEESRRHGMLARIRKIRLLPLYASTPLQEDEGNARNRQFSSSLQRLFPSTGLIADNNGDPINFKALTLNDIDSIGVPK